MKWVVVLLLLLVACSQEAPQVEENISALNNLGVLYAAQGDNERAKEYFNKVLDKDLSYETARNNLALLYFKEKDFNNSITQFTILIGMNSTNPSYHYDLGISLAENCRLNEICDLNRAIEEFEITEALSPGFQNAAENIEALKEVKENLNSSEVENGS